MVQGIVGWGLLQVKSQVDELIKNQVSRLKCSEKILKRCKQ